MPGFQGMSGQDKLSDVEILNRALFFENRGVWAYRFAAEKLSTSEVGRAVLALAAQNRADHEKHQDLIGSAIIDLGGTPVQMEQQYDLSSLIGKGLGNLESDVNIAKLALALEVGAAAGYVSDTRCRLERHRRPRGDEKCHPLRLSLTASDGAEPKLEILTLAPRLQGRARVAAQISRAGPNL